MKVEKMINNLDKLLFDTIHLVKKAGKAVMVIYQDMQVNSVVNKSDGSPLTQADLDANTILKEGLQSIADYPYLSEEDDPILFADRKNWETCWIVDPLDGTKEFLNKTNEFTINVALLHKGELCLGVVYAPAMNVLYYGSNQHGSFRQFDNQFAERLPLPAPSHKTPKILMSRSHGSKEEIGYVDQFFGSLPTTISSIGSSLKFCLLSEGSADLYPRTGVTREWDTAAGHAILNFTGGAVMDLKSKQSMRYNKSSLDNSGFVAMSHEHVNSISKMIKDGK